MTIMHTTPEHTPRPLLYIPVTPETLSPSPETLGYEKFRILEAFADNARPIRPGFAFPLTIAPPCIERLTRTQGIPTPEVSITAAPRHPRWIITSQQMQAFLAQQVPPTPRGETTPRLEAAAPIITLINEALKNYGVTAAEIYPTTGPDADSDEDRAPQIIPHIELHCNKAPLLCLIKTILSEHQFKNTHLSTDHDLAFSETSNKKCLTHLFSPRSPFLRSLEGKVRFSAEGAIPR